MRFSLIDRIVTLEPSSRLCAVKALSLAEEYLADHFPQTPVMPGVLMLEGLTQAAAWLVRGSEGFAHSMVLLKEAKNVKYGNFIEPGQVMRITAEIIGQDDRLTRLKAQGTVNEAVAVSARLVLERYNLADTDPALAEVDAYVIDKMRALFSILNKPEVPAAVPA